MKRSDTLTWSHVRTGILLVAALACAAAGILMMGDKAKFFVPKGSLAIVMTDVAGLKVGAPVWLAGVDVGIVTDIRFLKPKESNDIEILLEIDEDTLQKIGQDSHITIKTRGLMGEKYVDITPSATFHPTPEKLIQGAVTPKLDDVIQKAGTSFDRLNKVIDKVERGEGSLGRFMKDEQLYINLNRLTLELKMLTAGVNSGQGTLGKLTRSDEPYNRVISVLERAENALQEIQSADGTMGRLVRDRGLYDRLVALADKSTQAAEDVRELNRKLTSDESSIGLLLTDRSFYDTGMKVMGHVESSVTSLQEAMGMLNSQQGTAGKLLHDKDAYDRLTRALTSVDELLRDIKENPKKYVQFSLF